MPDADRPRRAAGIETAEFSDGLMVRQPAGRLHQLNNTASIVFELCDGRRTVAEIAGTLAGAFALRDPPLDETVACLADLRRAGVLADILDNSAASRSNGDPFAFFTAIYCLNQDERPDRWRNAVRRFDTLDIAGRVERFPAISTPGNHHVGCAMSWRLMIANARDRGLANFLGIEDPRTTSTTTQPPPPTTPSPPPRHTRPRPPRRIRRRPRPPPRRRPRPPPRPRLTPRRPVRYRR